MSRQDTRGALYRIAVEGELDPAWFDHFGGMQVSTHQGRAAVVVTILSGYVVDQAALRGLLTSLWDVNLAVIALQRMPPTAHQKRLE